jgi:hypothetical protein
MCHELGTICVGYNARVDEKNKKTIILSKNKEKYTNTKLSNAIKELSCVVPLVIEGRMNASLLRDQKRLKSFYPTKLQLERGY